MSRCELAWPGAERRRVLGRHRLSEDASAAAFRREIASIWPAFHDVLCHFRHIRRGLTLRVWFKRPRSLDLDAESSSEASLVPESPLQELQSRVVVAANSRRLGQVLKV